MSIISAGNSNSISHLFHTGTEKPISFTSRTLTKTEKNYTQIELEALSFVWGVKEFHLYLYICRNSHWSLTPHSILFKPDKAIPILTLGRIQKWALFLMDYLYNIQFQSMVKHVNADALSRLPLLIVTQLLQQQMQEIQVTAQQITLHYW